MCIRDSADTNAHTSALADTYTLDIMDMMFIFESNIHKKYIVYVVCYNVGEIESRWSSENTKLASLVQ